MSKTYTFCCFELVWYIVLLQQSVDEKTFNSLPISAYIVLVMIKANKIESLYLPRQYFYTEYILTNFQELSQVLQKYLAAFVYSRLAITESL